MKVYIITNPVKLFNSVCTTIYYTLVLCYHAQSKVEKGNKKRREGSCNICAIFILPVGHFLFVVLWKSL